MEKLLPDTSKVDFSLNLDEYILKPVWGRVGEKIAIKNSCSNEEYVEILKDVRKHKKRYISQKKFISKPINFDGDDYHVCLGSYTVDGRHAGFYARISRKPRIDSDAIDIPVVIERKRK